MTAQLLRGPTHRLLRRALVLVLTLTAVAWVSGFLVMTGLDDSVTTIRGRSSQAVLEVSAARTALVQAYDAAVDSFSSGGVRLSGPGERYADQLAVAAQSLARVAETNEGGERGSRALQVTTGLIASFDDAIGQAYAHVRAGAAGVGLADLSYASQLLHEDGGLLQQLDTLAGYQRQAAQTELEDGRWWVGIVVWSMATVALLVVLVLLQIAVARRFRRYVNIPLALAAAAVVVCVVGTVSILGSLSTLGEAVDGLDTHNRLAVAEADAADIRGQGALAGLLRRQCGSECQTAVDRIERQQPPAPSGPAAEDPDSSADRARIAASTQVRALADDASAALVWEGWILGVLLLAGVLVPVGLVSRTDEYWFSRS